MRVNISVVTAGKKTRLLDDALREYTARLAHYATVDQQQFSSEPELLALIEQSSQEITTVRLLAMAGR